MIQIQVIFVLCLAQMVATAMNCYSGVETSVAEHAVEVKVVECVHFYNTSCTGDVTQNTNTTDEQGGQPSTACPESPAAGSPLVPVSHCIIDKYQLDDGSLATQYSCDFDFACKVATPQFGESGGITVYDDGIFKLRRCCEGDSCNSVDKAAEIQLKSLTCWHGDAEHGSMVEKTETCITPYCYVKKFDDGSMDFNCDVDNLCMENSLGNQQTGKITDPITNKTSSLYCCAGSKCNLAAYSVHPSSLPPIAPNPGVREGSIAGGNHWKFIAGVLSAILLAVLVVIGAALFLKKWRLLQRRSREAEEYSYRQLTVDFENQQHGEDDRILSA